MSWWETLHLVTWRKRLGISAIKTGQDAPSWIWCTERLSFFGGGHIVLQRFVHVRCHFQPLPTKLVFAYFDRGSYVGVTKKKVTWFNLSWKCSCENKTLNWKIVKTPNRDSNLWMVNPLFVRKTLNYLKVFIRLKKSPTSCDICNDLSLPEFATKNPNKKTYQKRQVGGWTNPFEKYATVKMGENLPPRFGVKINSIWVATTQLMSSWDMSSFDPKTKCQGDFHRLRKK